MAKTTFYKKKTVFICKLDLILRRNYRSATFGILLCSVLKIGHFGTLIRSSWKHFKCSFGGGRRRPVGPIVLEIKKCYRVNEERSILQTIKKRKENWIDYILRRNCLLRHVIEAKVEGGLEMIRRRGRRRKQLLGDLKEERGYWKLKEEALDHTL